MPFPIQDRHARRRLESRAKPYFATVSPGLSIGYRRGKTMSRWVVRRRDGKRNVLETLRSIVPDDELPADGIRILDFNQVVEKIMSAKAPLACSFCGKHAMEVNKLIAGPSVFICDACVALCQVYVDWPDAQGNKLLIEDGKAVFRDGKPVFVPLSDAETQLRDDLLKR